MARLKLQMFYCCAAAGEWWAETREVGWTPVNAWHRSCCLTFKICCGHCLRISLPSLRGLECCASSLFGTVTSPRSPWHKCNTPLPSLAWRERFPSSLARKDTAYPYLSRGGTPLHLWILSDIVIPCYVEAPSFPRMGRHVLGFSVNGTPYTG